MYDSQPASFSEALERAKNPTYYSLGNSLAGNTNITPESLSFGLKNSLGDASAAYPNGLGPSTEVFNMDNLLTDFKKGKFGSLANYADLAKGISSLFGAYQGSKQLGLAEDQLNFQKNAFLDQNNTQKRLVNNQINAKRVARDVALGNPSDFNFKTKNV